MNENTREKFDQFLKDSLNESQRQAVTSDSQSLLVIAGAGSGKTRVITARIAYLILHKSIAPESIVALTFTNKAAREMQERIKTFLGSTHALPFIGTFHAYCVLQLKKNIHTLSLPTFSILDVDDQKKIIHGILVRNDLTKQTNSKQILYRISQIKNKLINPSDAYSHYANDPLFAKIYQAYEAERIASKCFDFDDLLLEALKLFTNDMFKENFQATVRHILVDEYQDTNVVQHELLKRMALKDAKPIVDSICVVGDEDQSIYSWRGATVTNMISIKKDFKKTKLIKIEQNYRSVQPVLEVANTVIKKNSQRNPKKLWTDRKATNRLYQITCLSEYQEGDILAHFLKASKAKNAQTTHAILYRTHFQSRALEEALIKQSLPYKIVGGIQFYERKEIKDLLAYMKLVVNPFDRPSFFRVINTPARSLGPKFEQLFYEQWHQEPFLTFIETAQKLIENKLVTGLKQKYLESFISVFENLTHSSSARTTLEQILTKTAYYEYLKKSNDQVEAKERIDNITELINAITFFDSRDISTNQDFLNEVALISDMQKDQEEDSNPILLMTLHAAKGLEFDTVIIPGLEEGVLPSSRSMYDSEQLEEERRLFYVGITRAKERVLFSHCRYRYAYGQMTDQLASQFLSEVPKDIVPHEDFSRSRDLEIKQFFKNWLSGSTSKSPVLTFTSAAKHKMVYKKTSTTMSTAVAWKKNQPVKHEKFGVGIIQQVEKRPNNSYIISVKFSLGIKKIAEKFLRKI